MLRCYFLQSFVGISFDAKEHTDATFDMRHDAPLFVTAKLHNSLLAQP
jgi:hypothetical protein